jgi:hypothetical protein
MQAERIPNLSFLIVVGRLLTTSQTEVIVFGGMGMG